MHVEVSVAINFIISYLYNKLPRRRVDMFAEELQKAIKNKFAGHWYYENPSKGSGYRSLKVNGQNADPVIAFSAINCGVDIDEVKDYLPEELTLWIDPMEVSYQIGEKGLVKILYSRKQDHDLSINEMFSPVRSFNPDAECFQPVNTVLSSSLSSLSLSPSSPTPSSKSASLSPSTAFNGSSNSINLHNAQQKNYYKTGFTTASFAQTKFGSTKLKTHAKRPTRLSPTEYFRQKNASILQQQSHNMSNGFSQSAVARPRSLSLSPGEVSTVDPTQRILFSQMYQQKKMPPDLLSPYMGHTTLLSSLYNSHSQRPRINQHSQLSPDASSLGLNELLSLNCPSFNNSDSSLNHALFNNIGSPSNQTHYNNSGSFHSIPPYGSFSALPTQQSPCITPDDGNVPTFLSLGLGLLPEDTNVTDHSECHQQPLAYSDHGQGDMIGLPNHANENYSNILHKLLLAN